MKAAMYTEYGSPEVVGIRDIDTPTPNGNEILVKVQAASINPYDWHFMRGTPYFIRIMTGLRKPKSPRLGVDVAGVIAAAGSNVTQFKPGDQVFGICAGAFGEYVCGPQSAFALKPDSASFEEAAAVPIAALTALQGLRNKGHVQQGQKVLINGAAGGVGTFAVQIAKSFGAEVTGVCSGKNLEMVRSIGADRVIDYTQEDFTQSLERYDLILDCIGNHSLLACRRVLAPGGIYIGAGAQTGRWMLGPLLRSFTAPVLSLFGDQKLGGLLAKANQTDLIFLCQLLETGKVTPVIDRRYSFGELREAIGYVETGHARGKVVIRFESA